MFFVQSEAHDFEAGITNASFS